MIDEEKPVINPDDHNALLAVSYRIIPNEQPPEVAAPKPAASSRFVEKHYTVVTYGPIKVRVSHKSTPTLQSGRRSKFFPLEGEAAIKRELKREKNRRTARQLKERQVRIELQLVNEVKELEEKSIFLYGEIHNLQSYKAFLEDRFRQQFPNGLHPHPSDPSSPAPTTISIKEEPSATTPIKVEPTTTRESPVIKTEPRCSSPQWQLLFSI